MTPDAEAAIQRAMGLELGEAVPASPVRVVAAGDEMPGRGVLVLEDGTRLGAPARLPEDLPYGYHRLELEDEELLLIAPPPRCPAPRGRSWGWAAQLYALRSAHSWGIGDFADLRELARWSRGMGAGFCVTNPLHAVAPLTPQEASPYFPSSRRFLNPLYLRPQEVPGAGASVDAQRRQAEALNADRLIYRDRIVALKTRALESVWRTVAPGAGFDAYRSEQGRPLEEWAAFCAIAERHGARWRRWPEPLRTPHGSQAFTRSHPDRVAFHAWLQWLADRQHAAAARELPLFSDMAVGFDPEGADAWSWQHLLAQGVTIGAPPDAFNAAGQDWNLPPFVPWRLQQARHAPFIETVRASLRRSSGIRIDHVMGLFRQWWVPAGGDPGAGGYVRYPSDELLAIVALEAHRAGAIVIGEDLGTVEPAMRETLAARGILSYRLLIFEGTDVSRYPQLALAAVSTHDLPTLAGAWTGADLEQQRRAGLDADPEAIERLRRPLAELSTGSDVRDAILAVHRRLADSPAALVVATLEDALAVTERPNLPGTTAQRAPNWSVALPRGLEQLEADPFVRQLAAALRRSPAP